MIDTTAASLRHPPQQTRSRVRLEALEAAGRAVYERVGRDRLTTADVAAEAACSIGTFYRFFPDRVALLDHLYPHRDTLPTQTEIAEAIRESVGGWVDAHVVEQGSAAVAALLSKDQK